MEVEEVEADVVAGSVEDEEAGEEVEEEVNQQAGWMMMNFMHCHRMHDTNTSKIAGRREQAGKAAANH